MTAMANPSFWYIGSTKWSAVPAWISNHAYAAGVLITNTSNTPAVGVERCFVSVVAGTSTNGSLPALTTTFGAKTADNTVTWQECTGQPAVNGDATNTPTWAAAALGNTVALGQIVKRASAGSYQICTTAGTAGSGAEPAFSNTAGVTTADNTVTWTSLGAPANFSAFGAPHARLANSFASSWGGAGNTFYVSNNHAETQSTTMALAMPGTGTSPCNFICVTDTTAPPTAVNTTATVTTTTTSVAGLTIGSGQGVIYVYGINFNAGSGAGGVRLFCNPLVGVYESCGFNLKATGAAPIVLGNSGSNIKNYFLNSTFTFAGTGQGLSIVQSSVNIVGGSIAATGSAPTGLINLFVGASGLTISPDVRIRDCDLSGITGTLVPGAVCSTRIFFENCKLGVGVTIANTTSMTEQSDLEVYAHNCDSGSKNYRFYTSSFAATNQQETTTILTGGASDGTQGISWNIAIAAAATSFGIPWQSEEIAIWNDLTGSSLTATIEIAGANVLTNGDIWMEVEYPGSSASPIGSTVNSRATNILTAVTNLTTSAASWGGSPAHTQKMSVTFTPQMKGPIKARIYVAKPSITVYVNPLITVV